MTYLSSFFDGSDRDYESPDESKSQKNFLIESLARYNFAASYVVEKEVLDLGCGKGYGSNLLLGHGTKRLWCIDDYFKNIYVAQQRSKEKKIKFLCMDANFIGLHNNSFDIVVAFEVIEHLEDDKNFLQETKRILKPQGILLLSTPNKNITSPGRSKPYNKFHKREYQLDEIKKLCSQYFTHVNILGQSWPCYNKKKVNKIMDMIPRKIKYLFPLWIQNSMNIRIRPTLELNDCVISEKDIDNAKNFVVICTKTG